MRALRVINKFGAHFYIFIGVLAALFLANIPAGLSENKPGAKGPSFSSEDSVRALRELNSQIRDALAVNDLKQTSIGILIYSLDNRKIYFEKNMDDFFTPASVTKTVTSFCSIIALGSNFPVKTRVFTNSRVNDGILNGDIFIKGYGDCLLSTTDMDRLADLIYSYGIREVRGGVYSDGSYFDAETSRFRYSGDSDNPQDVQPITALCLEKNAVTVVVSAGGKNGKPVNVQLIPPSDAFVIKNNAKVFGAVDKKGSRGSLDSKEKLYKNGSEWNERYGDEYNEDDISSRQKKSLRDQNLTISSARGPNNTQVIAINGGMEANTSKSKSFDMFYPDHSIAGTLHNRMKLRGISVNGEFGVKTRGSSDTIFVAEVARPLREILENLNKNSDNYLAETVFKILGAESKKSDNTAESARIREREILDSLNIPCVKCSFNDGSGLSRRNLVSPKALVRILEIAADSPFADDFSSILAVAGVDGTLKTRMEDGLAENNLKAKTGTLKNVSALAGYVRTLDGERLAFCMFFNGPKLGVFKQTENKIGTLLAQFFYYNAVE